MYVSTPRSLVPPDEQISDGVALRTDAPYPWFIGVVEVSLDYQMVRSLVWGGCVRYNPPQAAIRARLY